jgi:hypothetical protein
MSETWKDVVGYEGLYIVSDYGRCARLMKLAPHKGGYWKIGLRNDRQGITTTIHSLVASAFLGECPHGHEVNHIDGDKGNNRLQNLEYLSKGKHQKHSKTYGLNAHGERVNTAKLTWNDVAQIREQYAAGGVSYQTLAKQYEVSKSAIANIILHRTWNERSDISENANTPCLPEQWKAIPGWEKFYVVSSHGRCAHLIEGATSEPGPTKIMLTKEGATRSVTLPRLIYQTFVTPHLHRSDLIVQIDNDRANNRLDNLQLVSRSEFNRELAANNPNHTRLGEQNNKAKLTADDVQTIRQLHAAQAKDLKSLALQFGVTPQAVWHIIHRKTWKHVD